MADDAPDVTPTQHAPFAGVAVRDVVRDVVAAMALLVALPMPWDQVHRGSDRLEAVLVTVVALLSIMAPYALRGGMLPQSWAGVTTPRARVLGCAPYVLVALVYLVLDLVHRGEGGFGAGIALGLAGAVLAAAPRWKLGLVAATAVVGLLALLTPVLAAIDGDEPRAIIGAVLNALLVLAILWLTAFAFHRGELVPGMVLLGVGAVIAVELALLAGGSERPWLESVHGQRFGLLLLPAVAAFAAPRVIDQVVTADHALADATREQARGERWVAVGVRALDLVVIVAAFVALVAVTGIALEGPAVNLLLRLIFGALMAVVATIARRALARDPRSGHTTAVGAACLIVVLGIVIVIARAGVGTRSNVEELLAAFGLPAIVLAALLVPPSVRKLIASPAPAPSPSAAPSSAPSSAPADAGQAAATMATSSEWDATPSAGWTRSTQPTDADSTQVMGAIGSPQPHTPAASGPTSSEPAAVEPTGAAPATGAGPTSPVRDQAPANPDSTQVLPPVADVPGSRWTVSQALDPTTPLADLALIVQEAPHLRPHVAANPSTYPALLDWLGALGDPAVDAALRSRR